MADPFILNVVICCILTAFSLYLLITLLYLENENKSNMNRRNLNFWRLFKQKEYGLLFKKTCICLAFATFIRNLSTVGGQIMYGLLLYDEQFMTKDSVQAICNVLPLVGHMAIAVCGGSIIIALWFRQSIFYFDSTTKIMIKSKFAKPFNYFVFGFYVMFWCCTSLAYLIIVRYTGTKVGTCIVEDQNQSSYYALITISWMIISILMQISLLGLFIYPIYFMRKDPDLKQNEQIPSNRLRESVNKAAVLASICVATDLLTIAILTILYVKKIFEYRLFLYNINLVINQFVTVCYLHDWKKILWPPSNPLFFRPPASQEEHVLTTHVENHTSERGIRSSAGHVQFVRSTTL